jgi:AraC-like DNA-binding protein
MRTTLLKEITPLTQADCFTLFSRHKTEFDFPLHYHEEYELNFLKNAKGAQRIIGDHKQEIDNLELVLIGPNLPHTWATHNFSGSGIFEVTIQFHRELFDEKLLRRNQLNNIRLMFEQSAYGILYSRETTRRLAARLSELDSRHGFDSVMELLSILHDLSVSRNYQLLSDSGYNNPEISSMNSRCIDNAMEYMNQNFDKPIKLGEVARLANMTETAFSGFFKARTGMNFIDCLSEIRLGQASRMMIDTSRSISWIAYHCGFNNLSNFNRIFRKKNGTTPTEFRLNYLSQGTRIFI